MIAKNKVGNILFVPQVGGEVDLTDAPSGGGGEHAAAILAEYQKLKARFGEIDDKYSLAYIPPKLSFPPSLGLSHLTFEEKTEAELTAQATEQVLPSYTDKLRRLDDAYRTKASDLSQKIAGYSAEKDQKTAEIVNKYDALKQNCAIEIQNRNMWNSCVYNRTISKLSVACSKEKAVVDEKYSRLISAASSRASAALAAYQDGKDTLERERDAKIVVVKQKLTQKQNEQKLAVQKYNASVDEKEAKYQASCERAKNSANEQEYQRGLEAMRLYVTLGESGVEQQKIVEKYQYAKVFFGSDWTKSDALSVVQSDGFMQSHLGTHYSTLIDWINSALL